jgi:hypothetical protein
VRLGFSPRPKGQTFVRPLDGGQVAAHLTFIKHERERDLDVTIDVAIRFDAVEALVNRSNMLLSKKEKAETYTLGGELGNLEYGQPYRITIATPGDVEDAAERIVKKLETVGVPYIERFSHPEAAYDVLSRDDREGWIHCPIDAERAKRACALLAVLNRRPEIQALGARKLSYMESLNDPRAPEFSKFLVGLKQ